MAADDDLTRPLGLTEPRRRLRPAVLGSVVGVVLAAGLIGGGVIWFTEPGNGPSASTPIVTAEIVDRTELTGSTNPQTSSTVQAEGLVDITPDGSLRDVGGVVIGDVPSWRVDHMPYGGVKDSGLGRDGIRWAIEDMTEVRLMILRTPQ